MSVKKYKLVPAKFFENSGRPGEFVMDDANVDEKMPLKKNSVTNLYLLIS